MAIALNSIRWEFLSNFCVWQVRKLGMMAGGTGITPMLQIISAIMREGSADLEMTLIFANKSEDDILLRNMIEKLVSRLLRHAL